jgi:hypothetical protein
MRLRLVAILLPAMLASPAFGAPAPGEDPFPKKDLDAYTRLLKVNNPQAQLLAMNMLSHYEEGFDVLEEFILADPGYDYAATAAATLRSFQKKDGYEGRLAKLRDAVRQRLKKAGAPDVPLPAVEFGGLGPRMRDDVSPAVLAMWAVDNELTHQLYRVNPKKYAEGVVAAILAHLGEDLKRASFSETSLEEIVILSGQVEKTKLYPLIPVLTDGLRSISESARSRSYMALVVITGEAYPFNSESRSGDESRAAFEKYRRLYETKLKDK